MNWFAGVAVIIALGLEAYFVHSYDAFKYEAAWNKFQAQSTQAVSDARQKALADQKAEDAAILKQSQQAVGEYQSRVASLQTGLSNLQRATKAVNHVPEVHKFRCTPIPGALLAGLPDGPGSSGCDNHGAGEVHTSPAGPAKTHSDKL